MISQDFKNNLDMYLSLRWKIVPLHTIQNRICTCGNVDCTRPGKHPRTRHGVKDATSNIDIIKQWAEEWGQFNIGISLSDGFFAFDVDVHDTNGLATLTDLETRYGKLPRTVEGTTGGGGRRLLFKKPKDIKTERPWKPGIDILANDWSYFVAPPSRHVSGLPYTWIHSPKDVQIAELSDKFLEIMPKKSKEKSFKEVLNTEFESRNVRLTQIAGNLRKNGLSPESLCETLLKHNREIFPEPLPDNEVEIIAKSVARYNVQPDLRLTDVGNAERFAGIHGNNLFFVKGLKKWFYWKDGIWQSDEIDRVMTLARETIKDMYLEASLLSDKKQALHLFKHAKKSEAHRNLQALLAQAESMLPRSVDELDQNNWLLSVANGTLDLETGEFRPHERNDLITKKIEVTYDPKADCPKWQAFLDRVLDHNQELTEFLQRAIGYSLTGDTREQVLFVLYGSGANGKSTFLQTVKDLLGCYSRALPPESLLVDKTRKGGPFNDLAMLRGMRFVITLEIEDGATMAESLVKGMTGGDTLSARKLYHEFFDFMPTFKIFMATNHKPIVKGTGEAIWRRIRLIPFVVTIPPEERNKNLRQELNAELSGILNWALAGLDKWKTSGLNNPKEVTLATNEYRHEMDIMLEFLEDHCEMGVNHYVEIQSLYSAYCSWCEESNLRVMSKPRFVKSMLQRGHDRVRRHGGIRMLSGISLKTDEQTSPSLADF